MLIGILLIVAAIFLFKAAIKSYSKTRKRQESNWKNQEYVLHDKGEDIIRHAPTPDPMIGFANMPEFTVVGKKKITNRKNTRRIRCKGEAAAREIALSAEGLVEPLEISFSPFEPARQLEYGLTVPPGASYWDAFLFENSVVAHDTKHIPSAFMEYLTELGIPMSWLAGRNAAAKAAFEHIDAREKAALYGYAVYCSIQGTLPGNIQKDSLLDLFYQFTDTAARDIKIYNSISERPGSDLWDPSKRTIAYQFAMHFLEESERR